MLTASCQRAVTQLAGKFDVSQRDLREVAADAGGLDAPTGEQVCTSLGPRCAGSYMRHSRVAMYRFGGKGRDADGDVFRALRPGRAVLHPFTTAGEHRLAGAHVEDALAMGHAKGPDEHDGVLVEVGHLTRLEPAGRTAHVGDADVARPAVHPADVLVDQLGEVAGGGDACGSSDVDGHARTSHRRAARSSRRRLAPRIAVHAARLVRRTLGRLGAVLRRAVDLLTEDPHVGRRIDPQTDLAPANLEDSDGDRVTDPDHLADLPCQDEHAGGPSPARARAAVLATTAARPRPRPGV